MDLGIQITIIHLITTTIITETFKINDKVLQDHIHIKIMVYKLKIVSIITVTSRAKRRNQSRMMDSALKFNMTHGTNNPKWVPIQLKILVVRVEIRITKGKLA